MIRIVLDVEVRDEARLRTHVQRMLPKDKKDNLDEMPSHEMVTEVLVASGPAPLDCGLEIIQMLSGAPLGQEE